MFKTRTVGAEKQTLLANVSETTLVSTERLGKQVPAATDTRTTIEMLLETVFSTLSVQRSYKEDNWDNRMSYVREIWEEKRQFGKATPFREDLNA